MKRFYLILLALGTLELNLFLDRLTKYLATTFLKGHDAISYVYGVVVFYYIENTGAFLSWGAHWPLWLKQITLIFLPGAACLFGLGYISFTEKNPLRLFLWVSLLAGGLSNLFDRLVFDFHVVDFLNFGIGNLRTGILNVADLSVSFGVVGLLLYEFFQKKSRLS